MALQPSPEFTCVREEADTSHAIGRDARADWHELLPTHRLPVIAKTPMIVAVGLYMTGGHINDGRALASMGFAAALWSVLYALNEATDFVLEERLRVERAQWLVMSLLILVLCGLSLWVSAGLALLMAGMAFGQVLYCVPPVRLKRYWWAVLVLSGTINPILRLQCGAMWGHHPLLPLAYAMFVSLHLGAAIRSRCLLRERDRGLGYIVAPKYTEWAGIACTVFGAVAAYTLCVQRVLPPIFYLLSTIGVVFAVYAWSGRVTSMTRLRQGWVGFALLCLIALAALFLQR